VGRIEQLGDAYVVTLGGEIDAFNAPSLRVDLRRLVEETGASTIVVDLAAVTFLDSSALGALVGLLRRVRERNGRLRIVLPEAHAARIFELTGLDEVLDLYPGREAALSATSE
jgi:anti-sigma B factor antagonist